MMTGNFVNGEVHSADVDDSLIRLEVGARSDNDKDQLSLTKTRATRRITANVLQANKL